MKNKKIIIYTDGAARGNPGPAGAGAFLCDENGKVLAEVADYLGETTNNVAEYKALLAGLRKALDLGAVEASVFADSELMIKQLKGEYRVKNDGLKPLYLQALTLLSKFEKFSLTHVRREKNKEADRLSNEAIDNYTS